MFGYYTPLLILQAFCLYHAYRHQAEQKWYWFILIFPGVGCAIYLYHAFYNRSNLQTLKQGLQGVLNSNYHIEQMEKQVRFSDNVTNKTRLADAYMQVGRYEEALTLYKECLSTGFMADDPDLRMKALQASFMKEDYTETISYGKSMASEKTFHNSEARIDYAWALHYAGKEAQAADVFKDLDKSFTNYRHRANYCKFLLQTNKPEVLKETLICLLEEFEHMDTNQRRYYRTVINEVKEMARSTG